MTKYYLNDVEVSQEEAIKLVPISITEEVVLLREMTEEEKNNYYEELIISKIRQRYNINQELAILRQRDTKPLEYQEYFDYVETCKAKVKSEVLNDNNTNN